MEIFNHDSSEITIEEFTNNNQVVLIDFWTYTCINCIRTFPFLKDWDEKYSSKGLKIIGVHSPEFEFEKSAKNVKQAIEDFELKYTVVQDNDFKTWRAYKNRFWPAKYLIDVNGKIRYTHFGEGDYDITEAKIQELLEEAGLSAEALAQAGNSNIEETKNNARTPEIYLGYSRMKGFTSLERIKRDTFTQYSYPPSILPNAFAGSSLKVSFSAQKAFLVMRSDKTTSVTVYMDGEFLKDIEVSKDMLYTLVELGEPGEHILELKFKNSGTQVFAFTFG